ncbi:unnamed protein product, partial [Ectocarpus sp. 8 AP-2014]
MHLGTSGSVGSFAITIPDSLVSGAGTDGASSFAPTVAAPPSVAAGTTVTSPSSFSSSSSSSSSSSPTPPKSMVPSTIALAVASVSVDVACFLLSLVASSPE